jgi:hypothetical protein
MLWTEKRKGGRTIVGIMISTTPHRSIIQDVFIHPLNRERKKGERITHICPPVSLGSQSIHAC